jgi:hypothetical protein
MSDRGSSGWSELGGVAPRALADARIQLHWAAQTISAAADATMEPHGDDSHTSMRWDDALGALVGRSIHGLSVALEVGTLALKVIDEHRVEQHRLSLHGHSLATALAWVSEALGTDRTLRLRSYRMPEHLVASGGRFSLTAPDQFEALRGWYSTSVRLFADLALPKARALAVSAQRFDVSSIVFLDDEERDGQPRIGFGMSPGDPFYDQPYFYIAPSPLPPGRELPELTRHAHWHTTGFTAAVLTAEAVLAGAAGDGREALVRGFLGDTLRLSAQLIA